MMFDLLKNMKRKLMVGVAFIRFFLPHFHKMVEARPLLCSEKVIMKESL